MKHREKKGAVLIICMIFLSVFSALAVSMVEISDVNLQVANDHRYVKQALSNAHSGMQAMQYHFSKIDVSGDVLPADRLASVQTAILAEFAAEGITNITVVPSNPDTIVLSIAGIQSGSDVSVVIDQIDNDTLEVTVTGISGQFSRTVSSEFAFTEVQSGGNDENDGDHDDDGDHDHDDDGDHDHEDDGDHDEDVDHDDDGDHDEDDDHEDDGDHDEDVDHDDDGDHDEDIDHEDDGGHDEDIDHEDDGDHDEDIDNDDNSSDDVDNGDSSNDNGNDNPTVFILDFQPESYSESSS